METILFGIGTALALVCFVVLLVLEHKNEKHLDELSSRLASISLKVRSLEKKAEHLEQVWKAEEGDRETRKRQEELLFTGINNILNYDMNAARKAGGDDV
jgi:hypothetical protein|nr:MAG TPA: protein of unknown function (DUF4577) [Caudoviricetes sp.]